MKRIIIACEVFRRELEHLSQKMQNPPQIKFMKQGLHETPDILRKEVQKLVDEIENELAPESISLAYGFCGKGLSGVRTKKATLILPKVHDCIPLLQGTGPEKGLRPEKFLNTYWGSDGWVKYSQLAFIKEREARYKKYVEEYGQDSADYLLEAEESWKAHYTDYVMIKWDETFSDELDKNGRYIAKDMKLPYSVMEASSWYLQEILDGGHNQDNFFHIKPDETMDLNADGVFILRPIDE